MPALSPFAAALRASPSIRDPARRGGQADRGDPPSASVDGDSGSDRTVAPQQKTGTGQHGNTPGHDARCVNVAGSRVFPLDNAADLRFRNLYVFCELSLIDVKIKKQTAG